MSSITRTLRRGSSGAEVRLLQQLLTDLGFYTGPINGFFDAATERAVRAFQASVGIRVDGIVGPQTRAALAGAHVPTTVGQWVLVELEPTAEVTLARGVAAVNVHLGQFHVLAEGLPPPETFGTQFRTYRAWLIDAMRDPIVSVRLENCPATGTWVGGGGLDATVRAAVALIITAEPDGAAVPGGPEVLGGDLIRGIPVTAVTLEPTPRAPGATGFAFVNLERGVLLTFASGLPEPATLGTDVAAGQLRDAFGSFLFETRTGARHFVGLLQQCLPGFWVQLERFEPVAADVLEVAALVAAAPAPLDPLVILRGTISVRPPKPLG
jgi:hypothetical protein